MHIPKTFDHALMSAYTNKSQLDTLFVDEKPFIMRLVRHALRYRPWGLLSDDNDIYQEACIWILHYMWEWEEDRGTSLSTYVVYNVGVRLRNQIEKELAKKRTPDHPAIQIIYEDSYDDPIPGVIYESNIVGNVPSSESLVAVQRAIERVNDELPLLAKELLECLLLENGNFLAATRRLSASGRIRLTRKMSDDALRQWLRRNFLPKLQTIFTEENIITPDAKL